jgi:leucyl-tRNA---protein transferase
MAYLHWDQIQLANFSESEITEKYAQGYILTRIDKGIMNQIRSVRIDLQKFELSSENRRILRKADNMQLEIQKLPLSDQSYDWKIHKLGKDFYSNKFGDNVFSASKIKELITNDHKSNYTHLYKYIDISSNNVIGYAILYQNQHIVHYAYPFYEFEIYNSNYGMAMMLNAIVDAQLTHKKYIYLGSATTIKDKYKLQFKGIEWFENNIWSNDIEKLKKILESS